MKKLAFFLILTLLLNINLAIALTYGGLGGIPAYPREENPRTESIFVQTIEPGNYVEEGIIVTNDTDEIKTLYIYPTNQALTGDSGFACAQRADIKEDLAGWIKIKKTIVTLQPHTNKIIPFVISVPEDADVGEHNRCIAMEERKEVTKESKNGVSIGTRSALRVVITIPGEINKDFKITDFFVKNKDQNTKSIGVTGKNSGNVSLDINVDIQIYNSSNESIGELGGQYPVLRDKNGNWGFAFTRPSIFGGFYTATLAAEYNEDPNSEVGVKNKETTVKLEADSIEFYFLPSALGFTYIGIFVLFLISLITIGAISLKRKRWIKNTWITYKAQPNDDIKDLAKKFNVSWKLLAKANNLDAPYSLHNVKTIIVPPQPIKKAPPIQKSKKVTDSTSIQQEPLSKNDTEK